MKIFRRWKPFGNSLPELIFQLHLNVPTIDATKCFSSVANKANISEKTKHQAMNLMNNVVKNGIAAGKDPMGIAGPVYDSWLSIGIAVDQQIDLNGKHIPIKAYVTMIN